MTCGTAILCPHPPTPSPDLRRPPAFLWFHTRTVFLFVLYSFCQTVSSSLDGPLLFPPSTPAAAHPLSLSFLSPGPRSFLSFLFSSPPPPPPLLNTALTRGEAGLFLHVCQVLFLPPPPLIIPGSLYHLVALHAFQPSSLSFHPSLYPSFPSLPPLDVVSGVGPSLCAKVPPVYRAPDFPPALLSNGLLWFDFFFNYFF